MEFGTIVHVDDGYREERRESRGGQVRVARCSERRRGVSSENVDGTDDGGERDFNVRERLADVGE